VVVAASTYTVISIVVSILIVVLLAWFVLLRRG
jgi:hypothetical protein